MKKITIIFIVALVLLVVVFLLSSFYGGDRLKANTQVIKNCKSVRIGSSFDEVVTVMGRPYYDDKMVDGKRQLIYFMGGLQTETGIAFEFENNLLVRKFCTGSWEPE